MNGRATKELIHKVNNLISVIYTQAEVGRGQASLELAQAALVQIQKTAEATLPFVKAARAAVEADED